MRWRGSPRSLTGRDEDEGGSGIDYAGGGCEDSGRGAVPDGLVDTPKFAGRISRRKGTIQSSSG